MDLDSLGLYDIYGLHGIPFWQTPWFWCCCVVSAILLFVGLIIVITRIVMQKMKRPQTAWDKALRNLDILKQKLHQNSSNEYYYDELSSILKKYLTERFLVDCVGKTDDELCFMLEKHIVIVSTKSIVSIVQRGIDAKFAQVLIQQSHKDEDYTALCTFIKETIPEMNK